MKKLISRLAITSGIIVLSLYFARVLVYSGEDKPQVTEHKIAKAEIGKEFTCVLCGMKVKVAKNTPALDYQGKTYYFCSSGEKMPFSKEPERYISQESSDSLKLSYAEHQITDEELGKKAVCPVTNRNFTITKDTQAIEFQGKTYYFCCPGCRGKFMASQTVPDSVKVKSDSLKADPDSAHHNKDTRGSHKHKGCC